MGEQLAVYIQVIGPGGAALRVRIEFAQQEQNLPSYTVGRELKHTLSALREHQINVPTRAAQPRR